MRHLNKVSEVYTDPNGKAGDLYTIENGLHVRDVYIHAGIGEEVTIGHTSDLHFNYCNQQDLDEANPVIMSTLEKRLWQANVSERVTAGKRLVFNLDKPLREDHTAEQITVLERAKPNALDSCGDADRAQRRTAIKGVGAERFERRGQGHGGKAPAARKGGLAYLQKALGKDNAL